MEGEERGVLPPLFQQIQSWKQAGQSGVTRLAMTADIHRAGIAGIAEVPGKTQAGRKGRREGDRGDGHG